MFNIQRGNLGKLRLLLCMVIRYRDQNAIYSTFIYLFIPNNASVLDNNISIDNAKLIQESFHQPLTIPLWKNISIK